MGFKSCLEMPQGSFWGTPKKKKIFWGIPGQTQGGEQPWAAVLRPRPALLPRGMSDTPEVLPVPAPLSESGLEPRCDSCYIL